MSTIYTRKEILDKERNTYSKIPGMEKVLCAKQSERDAIAAQYPDAVFALMIANNLFGHDREQCLINQSAYFAILNGENINDVRFKYDKAMKKYVERHLWDD